MTFINTAKNVFWMAMALVAPVAAAQTPSSLEAMAQERAQRRAEQQLPRTAIALDPSQLDKFVGAYQLDAYEFFVVSRDGDHLFGWPAEREDQKAELYPESPTKFFAKTMPAQIAFTLDARGLVKEAVFNANGFAFPCPKVAEAVVKTALADIAARIKNKTPSPGTEAALRRYIAAFQHGAPNYDDMVPIAAQITYERAQDYAARFQKWGALASLTFAEVTPRGFDAYLAVFERARVQIIVPPLSPEGKIDTISIGKIEDL